MKRSRGAKVRKTPRNHDYRVVWEIDITAKSPREAARLALEIQRDSEVKLACVFDVTDEHGRTQRIDLEPAFA